LGDGGDTAAIGYYGGPGGIFQGGGSSSLGVGGGDGVDGYGGSSGGTGGAGNGIYGSPGQGYSDGVNWGLAGKFNGDVFVSGSLAKAGGSFLIDHPTDAANKYLYHSFVESPDMMNIYNGNIVTDAGGSAIVTMPDWFEALNRDFRYQLTVIGQQAQAWVASEVANRAFTIKTPRGTSRSPGRSQASGKTRGPTRTAFRLKWTSQPSTRDTICTQSYSATLASPASGRRIPRARGNASRAN